jgi:hypothetical protein
MASTAADVWFERLTAWGVDTIFGLPGDGINGFSVACNLRPGRPAPSDQGSALALDSLEEDF